MRLERTAAILCGLALWGGVCALPYAAPAEADAAALTCSAAQAKKQLQARVAERQRAERREAEARYVLYQTRKYSSLYGAGVGRWVRLARRVGWPKAQLPTLFKVIYRESRGNPAAVSSCGTYVGLLQFNAAWGFDRTDPRESLRRCLNSVREAGWVHWPTAY